MMGGIGVILNVFLITLPYSFFAISLRPNSKHRLETGQLAELALVLQASGLRVRVSGIHPVWQMSGGSGGVFWGTC